jgi:branched-chain amino acid transport system permease protein
MVELAQRLNIRRRPTATTGGVSLPVIALLVAGCVFLLIGSLESTIFAQQTVAGLAQGAIFASLALALVLIYRATGVINFAQGEMALATTYIAYQLILWGLTYWAAFFVTLVIAFAFGVVVQLAAIRPVQHRSVIAVVIVTIGLFILIDGLVTWKWGADQKFMPAPFGNRIYGVGGVPIAREDVGTLLVTIASVFVLWAFFRYTKVGLGLRAAALRPAAARLVGVRVDALLAVGWGLAAVLGAVAGLMTESSAAGGYVLQPTLMQPILLYAFAAAVLGGLESPAGAVVGGLALGVFLNLLGQYASFATSELRLPIAFAVLLVVLLLKPHGLFGRREVRRV